MKKLFYVFMIPLAVWSCSGNKEANSQQEGNPADSVIVGEMVERTYEGVIPGENSEGVQYSLTLLNPQDSTIGEYDLTMVYLGPDKANNKTVKQKGKYATMKGTPKNSDATVYQLQPMESASETLNFLYQGDSLILLSGDVTATDIIPTNSLKRVK